MSQGQPIKVMIVDDHLMARDGLKVFLSLYEDLEVVAEAADGQQAIDYCHKSQPDVVLMDMIMPNVDGPTATAAIKREYPSIQVIALSTFSEQGLVKQAIGAGAIGYLLKDVHADLTPREREVLALLVDGKTNREIAQILIISPSTARLHVSNILAKLNAANRTEAAALALQHNLL